jgi:hypothetical protein
MVTAAGGFLVQSRYLPEDLIAHIEQPAVAPAVTTMVRDGPPQEMLDTHSADCPYVLVT